MNIYFAPIQGVTTAHYRNIHAQVYGSVDAYYAPFITTTEKRSASKILFKDIFPDVNDPALTLIPQLLSNNGTHFREYAEWIVDMGYQEINWNIGCPFPAVTGKKRGSGILPYPDRIKKFLDEVCKDTTFELTVKMRLGFQDLEEGTKVIELLNDYPIKEVTIHGRTGKQKYEGIADLDAFEHLYNLSNHTIVYNGDIFSYDDYLKIKTRFPEIDNFMLARGILRNPALGYELKHGPLTVEERLEKLNLFHDALFKHFAERSDADTYLCNKLKGLWTYLSVPLDPTGMYFNQMKQCQTIAAYSEIVKNMLEHYRLNETSQQHLL